MVCEHIIDDSILSQIHVISGIHNSIQVKRIGREEPKITYVHKLCSRRQAKEMSSEKLTLFSTESGARILAKRQAKAAARRKAEFPIPESLRKMTSFREGVNWNPPRSYHRTGYWI
ncbi:hypothetical protein TNCV_4822071 [Trichonephila clavipes]|nr:hypothetical protein TNCV_4822071 [Trichonephila clavipes]